MNRVTKGLSLALFAIPGDEPIGGLRFDPFASFDSYADRGEMHVQSITIYRLPESSR